MDHKQMVRPQFGAGCITELMPALLGHGQQSLPAEFGDSGRVLFVLDGLGWEQFRERPGLMPVLDEFVGDRITTVAPSTTACALTSITTALSPAEHGIVGYRMVVDDDVFNCLRWGSRSQPDARQTIPPDLIQPYEPFLGQAVPYVTKSEFRTTGFTQAHLRGGRPEGYSTPAVLVHNTAKLIHGGEEAVYCYYDGIDKVAHQYGLEGEYEAELAFVDRMLGDMLSALPSGTTVMVSADHGHVDCGDRLVQIDPEVLDATDSLSGEARFRWLHAKRRGEDELLEIAEDRHSHHAWVVSRQKMIDENWFGPSMSSDVASRIGDVALLPFDSIGFADPADSGPIDLIGRHGSLTSAEMYVPCLVQTA